LGIKKRGLANIVNNNGPVRIHAAIAYDPDRKRMLMFGGFGDQGRTNELWEYANNNWSAIHSEGKIPKSGRSIEVYLFPGKAYLFLAALSPRPKYTEPGHDNLAL